VVRNKTEHQLGRVMLCYPKKEPRHSVLGTRRRLLGGRVQKVGSRRSRAP
jgi:hypothetical protein